MGQALYAMRDVFRLGMATEMSSRDRHEQRRERRKPVWLDGFLEIGGKRGREEIIVTIM